MWEQTSQYCWGWVFVDFPETSGHSSPRPSHTFHTSSDFEDSKGVPLSTEVLDRRTINNKYTSSKNSYKL